MARFVPRKSLLVFGLLAIVLGSSSATALAATAGPAASTHAISLSRADSAPVISAPAGRAPSAATPATASPAAEPAGGICSVPGIGDIGSLLHFCSGGSSGLVGDLNNICQPSLPEPEPATGGIDSIIKPPAGTGAGKTLYDNYGVAGQFWAATDMQCSDMTSLIGNNVAGMVFDAAKAVDRVTITVYQSAAGNGILSWLSNVVDRLISSLGNAIYFPYLAPVVLLGVMWLAWHGLIRKRATRTIEGTIWMVVACAAAIWLIGRPADFTGVGQSVSNGVTQVLNVAFSKLPSPGGGNCVPVQAGDPQSPSGGSFGFTQGNGVVDQNASELWSVLVCKPWLDGEFGTTQFGTGKGGQTPVNTYGRQLLWAQAIAANENPSAALIKAKQSTYAGIAADIKQNDPAIYPLFQGNQWTSRLEIGFAALFAALVAGVLVLLIAITLIILKLGFLLLLIAGPFFLIIGTHPGFGRVVAMRWVEMIIGVLLKQVAVAIVLSVLLYAYSLIMGTTDAVLPWALKILMIALVTIAVFIYRKPFQHLFSAVGYGSIGARERAEIEFFRSREVLRRNAAGTAAMAVGGFAGYRVGRWSRRGPAESATLAEHIALAAGTVSPEAAAVAAGQQSAGQKLVPNGHNASDANGAQDGSGADGQRAAARAGAGARAGAAGHGRAWAAADGGLRSAPPLHLPPRTVRGGDAPQATPSGWARGGVEGAAAGQWRGGDAPPRLATPRAVRSGGASPGPAPQTFRAGGPLRTGNGTGTGRPGGGAAPPRSSGGPAPRGGGSGGPLAGSGSGPGSAGGPARPGGAGGLLAGSGHGPGSANGPARSGGPGGLLSGSGGSAGGPVRSGGAGGLPSGSGSGSGGGAGGPVRSGGAGGLLAGSGHGPGSASGPGPLHTGGSGSAPWSGGGGPAPWAGGAGGAAPGSAPPGRGPAPSAGGSRARWGAETAQGQGGVTRGGRPLWQPGPIRPAGGWAGGAGAGSGPAAAAPYAGGSAAQPAAGPSGYGPGPGSGGAPAGSPRRSRGGRWSGRPVSGTTRGSAAGHGPAGQGPVSQGAAGQPGPAAGGQVEAGRRETPLPFWLRPVRRKK